MENKPKRSIPGQKDTSGAYVKPVPPKVLGEFKLSEFLFDKQLKFVEDPRPFKVAVCSRRSGKTVACAAHMVRTALDTAGVVCLYITLSRNNAKKLIWPELQKINRNYGLNATEDMTELSMQFPNGSIIYCSGAKDASEIEKFRGLALKLCYIDECQSFRDYIEQLIDDVIAPALLDYDGALCLIGTPGPLPVGYFAECAGAVESKQEKSTYWSHHGWTFFDNPWIVIKSKKTHQEGLDRELRRRGVTIDDPSIQREYYGKWQIDSDSLWIHYKPSINNFDTLPTYATKWNYILGIDLGFNDADALAVLAWHEQDANTYLIEEKVVAQQGLTELVEQIQELQTRYDISKMVVDEGGLGKKLAEEMRRRHHLPVYAADKVRKQENVAFLNDTLRTGKFKARATSNFAQDSMLVEIDRGKSTPDRIKLSSKYHSDIIDAVLYGFKESPAFTFRKEPEKPKPGTPEWDRAEHTAMFEAELEGLTAEWENAKDPFNVDNQ